MRTPYYFFTISYKNLENKRNIPDIFMSIARFSMRLLGNLILPIYFYFSARKYNLLNSKRRKKIIVSLTSFPARINKVWLVFECLVRQSILPDEVILYLSKDQFPTIKDVPLSLQRQVARGLRIELKDGDLRSHKKYHYAFSDHPNDFVITVDDDVLYDPYLIDNLMEMHKKFPYDVIANKTRLIQVDENGTILPYTNWKYSKKEGRDIRHVQIGIGGVLYQPNLLYKDILNWDLASQLCPNADDMWLYAMTRLAGCSVVRTKSISNMSMEVMGFKENVSLTAINVGENMNDKQIKHISQYYINTIGINPFLYAGDNRALGE